MCAATEDTILWKHGSQVLQADHVRYKTRQGVANPPDANSTTDTDTHPLSNIGDTCSTLLT